VEVDKTVTEKVNDDGSVQKDTETNTKVTDASGNVTEVKEIVNTTKDSSGLMNVKTTETTAADGSKTVEKVINAQTTDGSLRTTADVSGSESSDVTTILKVESSDDGNIELSTDIIQKALEQQDKVSEAISDVSQDHNKVIEVKAESEDTIMSMPQESFKGMSDNGSDFKMTSPRGSLTFSSDVLSNLSDMEDVSLSFTRADRSVMNEAQRNAVSQDSSIFDLKAMAGGESVGDRLGGNVDVAVKHTPAEGKTPVAYYLDDNGQKHRMDGQWFEKGVMHFITNHFSLYVIEDEVANPLPIDEGNDDSGSNTMLYAGVAIAIIAIIAIVAVVMVRRN
ncbi:MAG: hypothetical protein J5813_00605, partial [Candidatus Methanomethylophilaceae archaeon]|nr:hypothetical protein [Candidatus Methanomethylophilaceae archaeon]